MITRPLAYTTHRAYVLVRWLKYTRTVSGPVVSVKFSWKKYKNVYKKLNFRKINSLSYYSKCKKNVKNLKNYTKLKTIEGRIKP